MRELWELLLQRIFRMGSEPPERVRAGAGLVGHNTHALQWICATAIGVCWALSGSPYVALYVILVLAALGFVYFVGNWWFADKHPDSAALGGSEWRKLREKELAAKHRPNITPGKSSPDPLKAIAGPPLLLGAPEDDAPDVE